MSPFGVLSLGMIAAVLGAIALSTWDVVGVALLVTGAVMVQFGVIAAAVESAIVRARGRDR